MTGFAALRDGAGAMMARHQQDHSNVEKNVHCVSSATVTLPVGTWSVHSTTDAGGCAPSRSHNRDFSDEVRTFEIRTPQASYPVECHITDIFVIKTIISVAVKQKYLSWVNHGQRGSLARAEKNLGRGRFSKFSRSAKYA